MVEHPTNCTCRECEVQEAYERGKRESVIPSTDLLDRIAELEGMLSVCQGAINSLEEDAMGYANDGDHEWPNRDELLSNIDHVLSNAESEALT